MQKIHELNTNRDAKISELTQIIEKLDLEVKNQSKNLIKELASHTNSDTEPSKNPSNLQEEIGNYKNCLFKNRNDFDKFIKQSAKEKIELEKTLENLKTQFLDIDKVFL